MNRELNRHDFAFISETAKRRIAAEVIEDFPEAAKPLVAAAFQMAGRGIPGIVRREENLPPDFVPLGFVPVERYLGQRLRVAALVKPEEISEIVKPNEVLTREFSPRTRVLEAVKELRDWPLVKAMRLGVLGSIGLEILTGYPYTNETSDIDLVLDAQPLEKISALYQELQALAIAYATRIDLEVSLPNGYGVKAAEIFMKTQTLLGKSRRDVALLNRRDVLGYLI